jgi:hypothetical protein
VKIGRFQRDDRDKPDKNQAGLDRLFESFFWSTMVYEARIVSGLQAFLPVFALPVFGLVSWWILKQGHNQAELYGPVQAFELILPLSAGLSAAHLMTIEEDEGFDELRRSYPEPVWKLPWLRTVEAFSFTLVEILAALLIFRWVYGPYPISQVLVPALSPTLYLLGLSLLTGNLTRNYWAAAAVVMGYWFFEIQVGQKLGHQLFLFARTFPHVELWYELNRWVLCALGVVFLGGNFWLSARKRWGFRLGRSTVEHG